MGIKNRQAMVRDLREWRMIIGRQVPQRTVVLEEEEEEEEEEEAEEQDKKNKKVH